MLKEEEKSGKVEKATAYYNIALAMCSHEKISLILSVKGLCCREKLSHMLEEEEKRGKVEKATIY
jgi:hypothetical protein